MSQKLKRNTHALGMKHTDEWKEERSKVMKSGLAKEMRAKSNCNSPEARNKQAASMKEAWKNMDPIVLAERNAKLSKAAKKNKNSLANLRPRTKLINLWAVNFNACIDCKTNERPHKALSRCNACYLKNRK